jgi:hypothetical protein
MAQQRGQCLELDQKRPVARPEQRHVPVAERTQPAVGPGLSVQGIQNVDVATVSVSGLLHCGPPSVSAETLFRQSLTVRHKDD